MTDAALGHKATAKERWAWYLYDFGNSAYAAVVILAVYATYFKGTVVGGARGTLLWGIAVGIAMFVVAIISPVLGAIADYAGAKKRLLLFFTALSVVFTALLFFVQQGSIFTGMLFFILAEIGYRSSQVFYNSLLPDIAHQHEIGKVSGNGWAIGSAGGIVCLLIVLPLISTHTGTLFVRLSLVITAVFYAAASIPIFSWLKERNEPKKLPEGETYLSIAFKSLGETFRSVRTFKEFVKFVISFLVFNDGIMMALNFASILGAVLFGMQQTQLIVFMIIVQVTSVLGAWLFGIMAERISCKDALIASLIIMVGTVTWMFFNNSLFNFYIIGGLAGFALTGVQSVSRAMVGTFAPEKQSASFYGFFAVAGRGSSFIGPTVFGWVASWASNHYAALGQATDIAEQMGHRAAIWSIVAFLVIGLALLLFVNEKQGQQVARELS